MLSLLTVLVLTQTAPAKAPVTMAELKQCRKDSDCLISTTACCPGCCGQGPYATTRAAEADLIDKCTRVDCAVEKKCEKTCEPPASADAFKARCVEHECRMVAR